MDHYVIIGNGISGVTLARELRKKSECKITLISAESKHFISRPALMYLFMGHMKLKDIKPYEDFFWGKNRIDLVFAKVEAIDSDKKSLQLDNKTNIFYDKLIIASGSVPNFFNWPGQQLEGVQGFYSLQDLELMEKNAINVKHAIVVGGGLIGVEVAEMLHTRGIHVTLLVREASYWKNILPEEDAKLVSNHILSRGIQIIFSDELANIVGDSKNKVCSINTKMGLKLNAELVCISVGVKPNISFVKDSKIKTNRGILVNPFFETNIDNIFAIGDCAELENINTESPNKVEQLWYTGKKHAEQLARNFLGNKQIYQRGILFNSAKFFDLEYQTYGLIPAQFSENQDHFYWQAKDNDLAMHFCFDKYSFLFLGINTFGIRLRHKVFETFIQEGRTIEYVMENLHLADFEPEFFKRYFSEITKTFKLLNIEN